jgi:hypothetical protein
MFTFVYEDRLSRRVSTSGTLNIYDIEQQHSIPLLLEDSNPINSLVTKLPLVLYQKMSDPRTIR